MLTVLSYTIGVSATLCIISWIVWIMFIAINGERSGLSDIFSNGGLLFFICTLGSVILWVVWKCVLGG